MPEADEELTIRPQWFQILLALSSGVPSHGLAIMRAVLEQTDGRMKLWPATLYGSLRRLEERGWIDEIDAPGDDDGSDRRRFYRLTTAGRQALDAEVELLERYVRVARRPGTGAGR